MDFRTTSVVDLAEQVRGVSYGKEDASSTPRPGYLPVLRAGNITDEGLRFDDLVFVPAERISAKQRIRRHDVVIAASSGSLDVVGKAAPALADYEGGFGAFCKVLRPGPKVNPGYFAHYFKTQDYRRRMSALAAGVNINNLRNEHLDEMKIPLPPLPEQQRIAEVLDRAEALGAKRRAALGQLDTLTQSIFLDMFGDPVSNPKGWPRHPLGEVAHKITDGEHLNPDFSPSGMPIVMAGNVLDDRIDFDNAKAVEWELGNKFRMKCDPERGDLLLVSRGATIGRQCVVDSDRDFCLMGSVILIKPQKERVDFRFLSTFLRHPASQSALYKTSGSSAQQAIYLKDLRNLNCVLPPIDLQREFARRVAAVEKLKAAHRASLAELDALFAALQHRAFRGEL